ncbi:hypothetical protein BD809_101353 [Aquimarina intermedia]|uniref:Uncharacterized protein n=1 Tax=Aquimarina intermedia TaxID=350814 RepID=A0A5S5CGQ8_9FLAO|nr:hypothetical protein BD809_101353 [Aquimarina intermedia]
MKNMSVIDDIIVGQEITPAISPFSKGNPKPK